MRVLVCGGRDYSDWEFLQGQLIDLQMEIEADGGIFEVLIHGGAEGADLLAAHWAILSSIPVEEYEADWKTHGKAAGPIRNQRMLDEGRPDLVIAFAGGVGTADMVARSRRAGVEVREITGD